MMANSNFFLNRSLTFSASRFQAPRKGGNIKPLLPIILVMIAVFVGAFSIQIHIRTFPAGIKSMTSNLNFENFVIETGSSETITIGDHASQSEPAIPAGGNASISLEENSYVWFKVMDNDAQSLSNHFENLKANLCLYNQGKDLEESDMVDNIVLRIVQGGSANMNVENKTDNVLSAGQVIDCVEDITYDTKSLTENATLGIPIMIFFQEP